MEISVMISTRNFQVLKTFLGKSSSELMKINDIRNGRKPRENDFLFFLYHSMFWESETEEYEYLNTVITIFELEKEHLYNAMKYLRELDMRELEWLLKEMKLDYMTPTDIACAIVELAFEVVCLLEGGEF